MSRRIDMGAPPLPEACCDCKHFKEFDINTSHLWADTDPMKIVERWGAYGICERLVHVIGDEL